MTHEIKNQHGKHITDVFIRDEINYALERGLDYTHFEGTKLEIIKDFGTDKFRETVVNVEGL